MNRCRDITDLLVAELDGALGTAELARVETHVAQCAHCRRQRAVLAATPVAMREATAAIPTPDADREWARLSHRIRTSDAPRSAAGSLRRVATWGWSAAAAAVAIAIGLFNLPTRPAATLASARADYVQAEGTTSTLVYVDQESGWLIVWADSASANEAG